MREKCLTNAETRDIIEIINKNKYFIYRHLTGILGLSIFISVKLLIIVLINHFWAINIINKLAKKAKS